MKRILQLSLILLMHSAVAREHTLSVGYTIRLHSEVLNEEREIGVFLPEGYDETTARYPVLYLLDAETHLLHAGSSARLLGLLGDMPRVIVVGIVNTDRARDMTPPATKPDRNFPTAGGAAKFRSFIRTELQPYVDRHLRTEPFSILAGTSLSGLFVVHTLVEEPASFNAYIASSPSLWWDEGRFADGAITALKQPRETRPEFLYVSLAQGDSESLQKNTHRVIDGLSQRTADRLSWQLDFFDGESHNSTPLRAYYAAFKWLYADWRPQGATSLADLTRHFERSSSRFGYAIPIPDIEINNLAYGLLYSDHKADAIELFELNTRTSPGSGNAWDSLGEAYRVSGNLSASQSAYQKACSLGRKSRSAHRAEFCANLASVRHQLRTSGDPKY